MKSVSLPNVVRYAGHMMPSSTPMDVLQASDEVKEIRCNIPLDGRDISEYTSVLSALRPTMI